jgi:hypothetical protein
MRRILAVSVVILLCSLALFAATSPTNNCGTGADVVITSGKVWTNPSNITSSGQIAIVVPVAGGFSDYLAATNFGFSIPGGTTINGVQISFSRAGATNGPNPSPILDNSIFLTKNGTVAVGTDHSSSSFWTNSYTVQNYGSTTDLWGTTLAPADVNASTFGVLISVENTSTFSQPAAVQAFVTITVTYSGGSHSFSPGIIGTITRNVITY